MSFGLGAQASGSSRAPWSPAPAERKETAPARGMEHYAIFAKSFRERIEEEDVLLFDLENLEQVSRSQLRA